MCWYWVPIQEQCLFNTLYLSNKKYPGNHSFIRLDLKHCFTNSVCNPRQFKKQREYYIAVRAYPTGALQ